MIFFVIYNRKLQQNKYTAKMASAARRQIIGGGGAPINKRQKSAAAPTNCWRRRGRRTALFESEGLAKGST